MKQPVILTVRGVQRYQQQEPEVIELVTEGTLCRAGDAWELSYEESELTGLAGVTTTFRVEDDTVTLDRKGPLISRMVFREGQYHESLYQMEFGALMITVCAAKVRSSLGSEGGTLELTYAIDIENTAVGVIEYNLTVQPK